MVAQDRTKQVKAGTKKQRRVLFLTPFYDNTCGVGTVAQSLSQALRARNNCVDVLVYAPWRQGSGNKYTLFSSDGKKITNFANSKQLLSYLRGNDLRYDVLHSHNQVFSNSENEDVMKYFRNTPLLTQVHMGVPYANDILKETSPHGQAELLRQARMLAKSDKVIHLTEDLDVLMKKYYGSEHPINSGVIYNFAETPKTNAERVSRLRKALAPKGEQLVLYAGRMSEEKGVLELIKGFKRAKSTNPYLKLVLCGSDPNDQAFADQLNRAAKGLREGRDYVKVGKVSQEDLQNFYAASDFFIQPSRFEHFSVSLIEAMAHKKPIIMTKVPSMRRVMKLDENASERYAIPIEELNSPRAISKALLHAANASRVDLENMVERANAFREKELTPERVAEKYEAEYDALIHNKKPNLSFKNVYAIPFSNSDPFLEHASEQSLSNTIRSILAKRDNSQIIISPYGKHRISKAFMARHSKLLRSGKLRILPSDERITKQKSQALNKSFSESSRVGADYLTIVLPGYELTHSFTEKLGELGEAGMVYSEGEPEENLEARLLSNNPEGINPINQSGTTFSHDVMNSVGAHWDLLGFAEDMDLYQKMLRRGIRIRKHNEK